MRWLLGGCAVVVAACGGAEPPPPSAELLVLELGGGNHPLSPALRAAEARLGLAAPVTEQPPSPTPANLPPPPPAGEPVVRSVKLRDGETLWDLAREHLGAGHRWRVLLELNGWTERQSRRLRPGTVVRLPPR